MFARSLYNSFVMFCYVSLAVANRNNVIHPKSYHQVGHTHKTPRSHSDSPIWAPKHSRDTAVGNLTVIDIFTYEGEKWTAYEDVHRYDGPLVLVSATGKRREIKRYTEGTSVESVSVNRTVERLFGLNPANDVNLKLNDVLAERLLQMGEPVEQHVRDVLDPNYSPNWDTFLGNVQGNDTIGLGWRSETVNYSPLNDVPNSQDGTHSNFLLDGLLGGWLPSSRKIYRGDVNEKDWIDCTAFADVDSQDSGIVHLWFHTKWIKDGVVREKAFTLDYPEFLPLRARPNADAYYTALIRYTDYWESKLQDISSSWFSAVGGVDSRYGAFDRNYAGSEYNGFQDVFTNSLTANLLWGRFRQARIVLENYFDWYVNDNGDIKMRGPEVPQFGLSLSLIARYVQYTGDNALVEKYQGKILAWANFLIARHDESLKLPKNRPSYGLISGWSESDAALNFDAWRWDKPYWNNGAFAARGFKDLSKIKIFAKYSKDWTQRANQLIQQTSKTLDSVTQRNLSPPYVPVLFNETAQVIDDLTQDQTSSPQRWAHRVYTELLHASILSTNQTNMVIDSMQAYGLTGLGVVANVTPLRNDTRDMLGFISYGYALSLLLHDRIDEFVLFLYSHRYHVNTRGLWIAGEVAGTGGGMNPYCQPSQFGVPVVLRAALLFEHPDEEVLFVARGIPRQWLANGKVAIQKAPTRWGFVDFETQLNQSTRNVTTVLKFEKVPNVEVRVKLRLPVNLQLKGVKVNGKVTAWKGEEVTLKAGSLASTLTIVGTF